MSLTPQASILLNDGLIQLGLNPDPKPWSQYLQLLHKWNKAYNLTAIRDFETMVTRHLLDSLAVLTWVQGEHVLDVGSGAGFPGIPLALANPQLQVVVLDSNGKKSRFLQEVKRQFALDNVSVVQSRVENYRPAFLFDTVTSRAFSELNQMIQWTNHLIHPQGIWLAMKGRYPEAELKSIQLPYQVMPYKVPGLDSDRCCVIIKHVS